MRAFSGPAVLALALVLGLTACGGSDDAAEPAGSSASAGAATAAADGDASSADCTSAADKIQAKTKAVGYDTTVEISDCLATVKTSLKSLAADGEKAMAICAVAANEAFSNGVKATSVVSADGTELANDKLGTCQPS
jgi:hypothetical protein